MSSGQAFVISCQTEVFLKMIVSSVTPNILLVGQEGLWDYDPEYKLILFSFHIWFITFIDFRSHPLVR